MLFRSVGLPLEAALGRLWLAGAADPLAGWLVSCPAVAALAVVAAALALGFGVGAGRVLTAVLGMDVALALALAKVVLLGADALAGWLGVEWLEAGFGVGAGLGVGLVIAALALAEAALEGAGRGVLGTEPRSCSLVPTFTLLGSLMPLSASSRLIGTP